MSLEADLAAAVARELGLTKALADATAREQALAKSVSDILVREQVLTDGLKDSNARLKAAIKEINDIKGVKGPGGKAAEASSQASAEEGSATEGQQRDQQRFKWRDGRDDVIADLEALGSRAQDVATGLSKALYGTAYVVGRLMEGFNGPRAAAERLQQEKVGQVSWTMTRRKGRGQSREGRVSIRAAEARVGELTAELEESVRDRANAVSELSGIRVQYNSLRSYAHDLLVGALHDL